MVVHRVDVHGDEERRDTERSRGSETELTGSLVLGLFLWP
jgi:hypothetical protein